MKANSVSQQQGELVVELYKSLRGEAASYVEKVPGLWLQKFILLGTMLAFLLTQKESLDVTGPVDQSELAFDVALVAVALLASLLDAKILEYGLHARAISHFLETEFSQVDVLARWEATLWGYSSNEFDVGLVRMRSATTVLVTVLPTMLVIALVSVLIYVRRENSIALGGGAVACVAYIIVTAYVWRKVWPSDAQGRGRRVEAEG
jgi:hypothetical protein